MAAERLDLEDKGLPADTALEREFDTLREEVRPMYNRTGP
jgi:hypothetical protein